MIVESCQPISQKKFNTCKSALNYRLEISYPFNVCTMYPFVICSMFHIFYICDYLATSLQYGFLSQTEREVVWKNFQQKLKDMINSEAYDPKLIQEDMISKMMADLSWVEYCQSQSEKENEGMDMSSLYTM